MNHAVAMRASDRDREHVVNRLRTALEDGRLTTDEYIDRVGRAFQATTYGDLAPLEADLPEAVAARTPGAHQHSAPQASTASRAGAFARLPGLLRVLWAIWLTVVTINVVVWGLVSLTTASLLYPWPLWVAGPYGAALFGLSAAVTMGRKQSQR